MVSLEFSSNSLIRRALLYLVSGLAGADWGARGNAQRPRALWSRCLCGSALLQQAVAEKQHQSAADGEPQADQIETGDRDAKE